jgi:hypothetical protein
MPKSEVEIEFDKKARAPLPLFRHFQIAFPHNSMNRFDTFDSRLDGMTMMHISRCYTSPTNDFTKDVFYAKVDSPISIWSKSKPEHPKMEHKRHCLHLLFQERVRRKKCHDRLLWILTRLVHPPAHYTSSIEGKRSLYSSKGSWFREMIIRILLRGHR